MYCISKTAGRSETDSHEAPGQLLIGVPTDHSKQAATVSGPGTRLGISPRVDSELSELQDRIYKFHVFHTDSYGSPTKSEP